MSANITYYGHSAFLFDDGKQAIAVDPFLTGNPVAKTKASDVRCNYVGLTHGHADHIGDAAAIAKANDAAVIAVFEIAEFLSSKGVSRTEPGNPGGKIKTDFGWVAFTQAFHSSSYEGKYMGQPTGLVVHIGGVTIYHCGDTALFSDMKLIGEIYKPQVACIPIGDRFTMGPELASRAAEMIKCRFAIPIHYNTWPPIAQDPAQFKPSGVEVKVMKPGDKWSVSA